MIESVAGAAGAAVLLLGLALASVGLYGMLRKPTIFEQLHPAGLVTGPGLILVMLAALASGSAEIATSAMLLIAFVLVTGSLSTHTIALAAWHSRDWSPPGGDPGARLDPDRAATSGMGMRVLLAHDGSPGAEIATALAASLAWPEGSRIRLIGATDGDVQLFPDGQGSADDHPAAPARLAQALTAAASRLQGPGLAVDQVVHRGEPATAIADEAAAFDADLVIIGSRGLGPVETVVLGSVAAATVDTAPCSVLVARVAHVRRAVLAADGSASSDAAVAATMRWPMFGGVPIAVLAVNTDAPGYGQPSDMSLGDMARTQEVRRIADAAAVRLIDAGRQASAHVQMGDAAAQIVGFASGRAADLIVVGTRRRTGIRRAILGSVGRSVLTSAEASVLVVKTRIEGDSPPSADD
jgi:multicomponent Na+:H+ antiporter subunit G